MVVEVAEFPGKLLPFSGYLTSAAHPQQFEAKAIAKPDLGP
jgi:hypothetical protein